MSCPDEIVTTWSTWLVSVAAIVIREYTGSRAFGHRRSHYDFGVAARLTEELLRSHVTKARLNGLLAVLTVFKI